MSVWFRRALGLVAVLTGTWSSFPTATAGPIEDCSRLRAAAVLAPCSLVIDDKAQTPEAHVTALVMRARAELDLSELDKAEADLKAAFALRPTPFGYRVRGRLHGMRGQNAEARDDYLQAISLSENKSGRYVSYVDRGLFLVRIKDFPAALADFELAIRLDPTKASAFVGRALTHRASGKIAEALADLNHAKAVEPSYSLTYVELGDIFVAEKRFADAIAAYDVALKLQPTDARAIRGRAAATTALASNNPAPVAPPANPPAAIPASPPAAPVPPPATPNRTAQPAPPPPAPAVAAPTPVPSADPADPAAKQAEERRAKLKEAIELRQKGKNVEAIALYDALLKQTPADAEVAVLKGRTLIALTRWKEALDVLKTVVDNKTAPPALRALAFESQGEVLVRNNLFALAISTTTAALQINPKLEGALLWRGLALYSVGSFDKALADFRQGASLQPKSALFVGWEANALVSIGELQKAKEAVDRALALQADNAFALTARARVRLAMGEIDAAEADLSRLTRQGALNSIALQTQQLIMVHRVMKPSDQPLTRSRD